MGGSQQDRSPNLTLPRGILGEVVLGLVRACPVLIVTRDTRPLPEGKKA